MSLNVVDGCSVGVQFEKKFNFEATARYEIPPPSVIYPSFILCITTIPAASFLAAVTNGFFGTCPVGPLFSLDSSTIFTLFFQ